MSIATNKLNEALEKAMANRPKIGGFPYLAEYLRQAGVQKNIWALPSAQSVYVMESGNVVMQGKPLRTGMLDIPDFNEAELVRVLRIDQAGETTFPEFLEGTFQAGVVGYEVDFAARRVDYYGASGEVYREEYSEVEI